MDLYSFLWEVMSLVTLIFFVAFSLFWFLFRPLSVFISGRRKRRRYKPIDNTEGVSVILPCYNEEETIEDAIKSILSQKVNREMEIIAVENNSTDNTFQILKRIEEEYPEVRAASILTRRGYNPISEALNHGISLAKYPVIVRLDADTQLGSPTAIEEAVTPIVTGEAVATCCNVRIVNPTTVLEKLQAIDYFFAMELDRRSQVIYQSVLCCSGAMSAFQTDALRAMGGYHTNPNISEDMEITLKMHKMGKVAVNPRAISLTDAPKKIKELSKQRYIWNLLGVICLFVHRKYIGDNQLGRGGLIGVVGLPMKLIQTYQAFVGIALKAAGAMLLKGFSLESLYLFGLFSVIHLAITGLTMAIVAPVAHSKQGTEYWYLLPLFSLVYQPYLALIRFFGTAKGLWLIARDSLSKTRIAWYDEDHTGPKVEVVRRGA